MHHPSGLEMDESNHDSESLQGVQWKATDYTERLASHLFSLSSVRKAKYRDVEIKSHSIKYCVKFYIQISVLWNSSKEALQLLLSAVKDFKISDAIGKT